MASFNKVILMGNMVRDPELRVTASGLSICKFTVATSRTFRSQESNKEETAFIDVECFGKQADVVSKYFSKGRPIFLEGRLRLNEWESNNGEKRSKLLVVLENFQFVGNRKDNEEDGYSSVTPPARSKKESLEEEPVSVSVGADIDEDVPF